MSSVGSLFDLYNGYPKEGAGIAKNDLVVNNGYGARVAFPSDCVSEAGRKMYAKCLFEFIARRNDEDGGSNGSHPRVGITSSNPKDSNHGVPGGTCVVYSVSPKNRTVEVRVHWSAAGSLSHLDKAVAWANTHWRKPNRWQFLPTR